MFVFCFSIFVVDCFRRFDRLRERTNLSIVMHAAPFAFCDSDGDNFEIVNDDEQ